jgi:GT2 family glycosyltransferase
MLFNGGAGGFACLGPPTSIREAAVISAIVPVWNGRAFLEKLLPTLHAQTSPAGELLIIDNGSEDGAPDVARKAGATVIPMGRNAGFAAAVNRGIRESRGDWVAVLNSDVELAPDYFERLQTARGWFATGRILSAADPHTIDATFDATCCGGTTWRVGSGRPDGPAFRRPRRIWSAPWTAALFRAELFREVGILEEHFGSYLEDVDFGLRCAKAGCEGDYLPDAVARHHGSAALGRWSAETVRLIARNQVLLLARHYPEKLMVGWMWRIVVAHALWGAVAWRHGAGRAWWRGKREGLRGYAEVRRESDPFAPEQLEQVLTHFEREIGEIQTAGDADFYWRVYFLLATGGAK